MHDDLPVSVNDLTMAYGRTVIQRDLSFEVPSGEIFLIVGGSGSGKSTLLRHLIGLQRPSHGRVLVYGSDIWAINEEERRQMFLRSGVLYQNGALWSSMTVEENIALPLRTYTNLSAETVSDMVSLKLALVGLRGCESRYPSALSGGMRKRAALARALALDPRILYLDEPSAGLDPVTARTLDELIVELRNSLHTTMIIVTHELGSIFRIGDRAILLDAEEKTIIAEGSPADLRSNSDDPRVRRFFSWNGETRQKQHSSRGTVQ